MKFRRTSSAGSPGFSLIEVLVATTVLMIIVMMIALVFQQSSGAWSGGTRRTKSQTTLRGVLGIISRELTEAVPGRSFPGMETKASFAVDGVTVVTLTGKPGTTTRVPKLVRFSYDGGSVKRSECRLAWDGKLWKEDGWSAPVALNADTPLADFRFKFLAGDEQTGGLPTRIDIEASVQAQGTESLVSGRSSGRDKRFDTRDDVMVGT